MRQWKIKSQILILQIIANLLVAALVAGYLLFVQNLLIKQQEQDQRKMLLQKIEILTTEALSQYARSIEYVNYQSQQSIRSIQEIFLIMQRYNIYSKENSGICEYFKKETNQFCYLIPNQSSQSNTSDYFTLTNLMDSLKHQIPVEKLYFVSSQDDQYFSIYPTFILKNYYPHSRPWYKNHQLKQNTSLYVLSDPYISMFSGVMFTETTTLKDQNFIQKGVIGHDYNMSSFSVFDFQIDGIKISLIDMVGRLLISSYYKNFSLEFKFIQNESLTGLNESNFQEILKYTIQKDYKTQCLPELKQTLCIEINETAHQLIRTQQIKQQILILQIEENVYQDKLNQLITQMQSTVSQQLIYQLYYGIGSLFTLVIMNYVAQIFISRPLKRLKILVDYKQQIGKVSKILLKNSEIKSFNWIEQLEHKINEIYQFENSRKKNNQELISIQQIQYPLKVWKYPSTNELIMLLPNNVQNNQFSNLNILFENKQHLINKSKL
ncbi:unnamed protein product [Paramecium pentaurelia]|uniref:Uncharacterized protein n=1 Tax=Paramecium pentaurelia TaxID=43138 RepID=A0A8S1W9W4_9CILI|nr:unnamed protein product [Paramecium pentaurelia]